MNGPVLVTGPTGNVGRAVVRSLLSEGVPVRAAVKSPERTVALLKEMDGEVMPVPLDFLRPETFRPALEGVRGVFLLRPPAIAHMQGTLNAFVDAAVTQGVKQVVFLSVDGAEKRTWIPHHAVEEHLKRSSLGWTLLRPTFFAQNLGDAYREDIRQDHRLFLPAAQGRVAFVDVRDVGDLVTRAMLDTSLRNRAFTLTGPESVTFDEVAVMLSEVLGRPIRYEPASVAGYVRHLHGRRMPWGQVGVQTLLHVGLRFGQAEQVDPTLANLLGRPTRTVRQYIEDHAPLWR
ncbi:SDR family oxidoreductase [Corallococcus sicarius]|uniref:SDR family oxidoreductase n=1 Tax=Corallococcus sicarius TaxID=2316726 RepID=A0A3A8NX61_9BACT|nr:SDR family oxidoreductase [Corallococcus sicarius]RKH48089.1 SDR family oxidoreductase [Corallococcus sicarius]